MKRSKLLPISAALFGVLGLALFAANVGWLIPSACASLALGFLILFLFGLRIRTDLRAGAAVVCFTALVCLPLAGCTAAQKQTTLQVVEAINGKIPEVVAAADTVAATVAALAPADAALINVCDGGFDAAAQSLQALTAAYIANPSATVLQQIQTAINTLSTAINTATLQAVGIKDATSQKLALAALKGLLTVVTVVFALIQPTESVAMLNDYRSRETVQLARLRPYMDEGELEAAARSDGAPRGLERAYVNMAFADASAQGF